MVICIIHHHHHNHHHCSLILTKIIPKPVRRFRLLYLVHRAGENRETEPPPLLQKKNPPYPYSSPDIHPKFPSLTHPPSPIPSSSQPSHKKSKSSQIMLLSSIISFSNDAAAIEKTLRGIQGLATIAIGFYQQQPQHTQIQGQIQGQMIQGQMIQEHLEMWIKLRGELALGMQIHHHHHHNP